MKIILLLITTLSNIACAHSPQKQQLVNLSISPGEVRWIEFPIPNNNNVKFKCRGKEVKFIKNKNMGQALVMESYFSDLAPFSCVVENQGLISHEIHFAVKDKEYLAEKLRVDPKKIKLDPKSEKRVHEEQIILNKIYASSPPQIFFDRSFTQPLNSVVTSVYGTKRVYNKKKKGQHLGIDYRAAIGDKVPAANSGKIVLADDLFYTGWTVIIDHGLDIFTVYGHLSKTMVKEGDMVKQGDIIGLSGNTGRTSGPHLHWGTKVQGQYIDGFVLIEESKKYFDK